MCVCVFFFFFFFFFFFCFVCVLFFVVVVFLYKNVSNDTQEMPQSWCTAFPFSRPESLNEGEMRNS